VANFVSFAAFIAELAHGEKSRAHSIPHSSSLFDAQEPKLALRKMFNFDKIVPLSVR